MSATATNSATEVTTEFLEDDHRPADEQTGRKIVDELRHPCRTCHRERHEQESAAAT